MMLHRPKHGSSGHARWTALALAIAATVLAAGCGSRPVGQENVDMAAYREVPDSAWARLRERKIWFGHQSVGGNIMEGVTALAASDPRLGLRVAEGGPGEGGAGFTHTYVGRNGEPGLKTDEFAARLDSAGAAPVDVALHKYCYADIVDTTDVQRVFDHYRETMTRLAADHPGVTFVHVTAPLVMVQSGPRAMLKKLLGQAPGRYASNFRREQFNELMRREYAGREPFFDLAAVESTRPDGSRETIEMGGRKAFALFPGYSDDGSHLNATGKRRAAEELLVVLAGLPAAH